VTDASAVAHREHRVARSYVSLALRALGYAGETPAVQGEAPLRFWMEDGPPPQRRDSGQLGRWE
jgi:hypothetical protein